MLRAVEALDTARERVKLSEICNNNVEVFGRPNSTQRKCVQTFWQNVKRQHIRGYVRRLEKFGILPSETTRRLLEGAKMVPSPDNKKGHILMERCLLTAVEALDISRDDVSLPVICNRNVEVFGRPASKERRKVQKWNKWSGGWAARQTLENARKHIATAY